MCALQFSVSRHCLKAEDEFSHRSGTFLLLHLVDRPSPNRSHVHRKRAGLALYCKGSTTVEAGAAGRNSLLGIPAGTFVDFQWLVVSKDMLRAYLGQFAAEENAFPALCNFTLDQKNQGPETLFESHFSLLTSSLCLHIILLIRFFLFSLLHL